jgi:hypothetical protein
MLATQVFYQLSHSTSSVFVLGISKVSFCELLVWGWLGTLIFLISASKVARIIGVSHQFLDLCECSKIEFIKIHTF